MPPKGQVQTKNAGVDAVIDQASRLSLVNFVKRPDWGRRGRPIEVFANSFAVMTFPTKNVIQYDVTIGDAATKRAVIKKVWSSAQLKNAVGGERVWRTILFDGNKLAWSERPLPFGEILNTEVDLAREFGKKKPDIVRVLIRKTATVVLEPVNQWINGKCEANSNVQQGMTFLNHLISQSLRLDPANICLKRSFFRPNGQVHLLPGGLNCRKGIFMSVRGGHGKLTVNVDVATAVFWSAGSLLGVMQKYIPRAPQTSIREFVNWFVGQMSNPRWRADLRKFKKITFFTKHADPTKPDRDQKRYVIDGVTDNSATNTTFLRKIRDAQGVEKEVSVSVAQYFQQTYRKTLEFPQLPLIRTKRGGDIPMECCFVTHDNKYMMKLDDQQTATMIKFTATRPDERRRVIEDNVQQCRWGADQVLAAYGMKINPNLMKVEARILPAPTLEFNQTGRDKTVPGNTTAQGNWDLRGKKFIRGAKLQTFGIMVFATQQACPPPTAEKFLRELTRTYTGHGGEVTWNNPPIGYASPPSVSSTVKDFYNLVGNKYKRRPDILFFIMEKKSTHPYSEIKQYCETNLGVVSQCAWLNNVQKCAPQYLSNVCMKLNAKLGGSTCYLATPNNPLRGRGHTLMIGADVSHAAPGSERESMASMVGSVDMENTRYGAITRHNGVRTELISDENMDKMFAAMLYNYKKNNQQLPQRILYFRDGVSEQQYHDVIGTELKQMRKTCQRLNPKWQPKFTVTICTKRHHHRFFPAQNKDGDRNGNVMPGTIIEKEVTDPMEYDFYLNSHKAIQGTARSTHYYVIHDESKIPVDDFQSIIHNMCFTYIRSTTSVSIIPPVYYAHLASKRGLMHEAQVPKDTPEHVPGQPFRPPVVLNQSRSGEMTNLDLAQTKIMVLPIRDSIQDAMFYV